MKIIELLLEYNRPFTAKRFGLQILNVARQDKTLNINHYEDDALIEWVLDAIESRDPTPNKEYTQHLVKLYVTGNLNIYDINQNRLLEAHWIGKRRGMIKPEHANFNNFKTYTAFETAMLDPKIYNVKEILTPKTVNKGRSEEVYQDNQVRIVVPYDKTAACYYGRSTEWCTAYTEAPNRFDEYTDDTLYMILPKQPRYPKEKYQFYWLDLEFKNDQNKDFNLGQMLEYYPGVADYFRHNRAEDALSMIPFWSDKDLTTVCDYIINNVGKELNLNSDDRIIHLLTIFLKPKAIMNWVKQNYDDTVDFSPRYLYEYVSKTMRQLNLVTEKEMSMLELLIKKYNGKIVNEITDRYTGEL